MKNAQQFIAGLGPKEASVPAGTIEITSFSHPGVQMFIDRPWRDGLF
jgi:hypothetical protein